VQRRSLLFLVIVISSVGSIFLIFSSEQKYDLSKQIIDECNLDVDCGVGALLKLSKTNDEKIILDSYIELKSYYRENVSYCHQYGHHLGMFLYNYYEDYEKALSIADSACGDAIYHGIVESYLVKFVNPDVVDITVLCQKYPRQLDRENLECVHGIGHVLLSIHDDVFVATDRCGDFTSIFEIDRCVSEVFMENFDKQSKLKFAGFNEDDLHYPCNSIPREFVRGCYMHQVVYIAYKNNNSVPKSFEECDSLSHEDKKYCYQGLGVQISGNNFDDINHIMELCGFGDIEYQPQCIIGAVMIQADHKSTSQAFEFCKISPDYSKEACYDALGKWTKMLYGSEIEIKRQCSVAENSKYINVCLDASLDSMF